MKMEYNFFQRINKQPNGCWNWSGAKSESGYGEFYYKTKRISNAHRYSYRLFVGDIPKGLAVDHQCNNRLCVNPKHLKPMSARDNVLRGIGIAAKNSKKTICIKGHPLSGKNLFIKTQKNGLPARVCIECRRGYHREWLKSKLLI